MESAAQPSARASHHRTYFFVHVMKTAGMTFNRHIRANFAPEEVFPGPDDKTGADYWVIRRLHRAVEERRGRVRVWRGHFPYYVTSLVPEAETLTLLREPVARTISLLEQRRAQSQPEASLEELYDDPGFRSREISNHQTKIFSLSETDEAATYLQPRTMDRDRLRRAKATLETVDLLGVQERFDEFLAELQRRWGWSITDVPRVNVGDRVEVSTSFRRRIEADNELDAELYEHALGLVSARSDR